MLICSQLPYSPRVVKHYDNKYSAENILCQSIKQLLDRTFNIKYPNRNKTIRNLFSYLSDMAQMDYMRVLTKPSKSKGYGLCLCYEKSTSPMIPLEDTYTMVIHSKKQTGISAFE